MRKIVIYGAGRVGTCLMAELSLHASSDRVEVIMYAPHNSQRLLGAKLDLEDAAVMVAAQSKYHFRITDNPEDFAGAEAVLVSAGGTPSKEDYARAAEQGIDDRTVQGMFNIDIMQAFAQKMQNCPQAVIFVLSNPVDMMCNIIRKLLPTHQVYGLGCWLDTMRFRRELWQLLRPSNSKLSPEDIKSYIIGHHNDTMFVWQKSLEGIPASAQQIAKALQKTRDRGLLITQTAAKASVPQANTGSCWAPALMVSKVLQAFINGKLFLPMNRNILPQESEELAGAYVQLPCLITRKKVKPIPADLTHQDIANLRICLEKSRANAQKLRQFIEI